MRSFGGEIVYFFGQPRDVASIRIDRPQPSPRLRRVDNHSPAPPTSAPAVGRGRQELRKSTFDCDFLEFPIREKPQVLVVRRPERVAGAFGSLQNVYRRSSQVLHA